MNRDSRQSSSAPSSFLPLLLFFVLIFFLATYKIFNLDFWWHLKAGEVIVNDLTIPRTDIFSHTAEGREWVPTQWLFQVTLYLVYSLSGVSGVILAKALLSVIIFALLLKITRRNNVPLLLALPCLLLFAALSRFRLFVRPDIASFFFLAAELYLLDKWSRDKPGSSFFLLPLAMFGWANYHSGATIGLAVLALFSAAVILEHLSGRKRLNSTDLKKTALLIFLSSAATLVNPNGINLYLFALEHYDIYEHIRIGESIPPSFGEFPLYFIVLPAVLVVQLITIRKSSLFNLLLLILFSHLSFKTARMIAWWAVAIAPLTALNLYVLLEPMRKGRASRMPKWSGTLMAILFMSGIFYAEVFHMKGYHNNLEPGLGLKEGVYPKGAVDFIISNDLKGKMYNDQDFGGYILWRAYPERKVFMDPRMQVYYHLFPEFDDFEKLLKKYEIEYGILEYPDTFDYKTIPFPEETWALVYFDDVAMVYVRKRGDNSKVIKNFGYSFLTRPYDEEFSFSARKLNDPAFVFSLRRELSDKRTHKGYRQKLLAANLQYKLGNVKESITLLKEAISIAPRRQNAYYHLGTILIKTIDKAEGVIYLEECIALSSYSKYGKLAASQLKRRR